MPNPDHFLNFLPVYTRYQYSGLSSLHPQDPRIKFAQLQDQHRDRRDGLMSKVAENAYQ